MAKLSGGQALVKSMLRNGVDTLFALPGIQLDAFFNALHDEGDAIRVIGTRHEQGAAYMATGYAQSTGRVGAYSVVPGPGFLNSTAALATAYACGAPVLCVTGQIPSRAIGKGLGLLHEIPDQLGIARGLTKWAHRIEAPADAPGAVREAFRHLRTGPIRPVELEMAMDVMAGEDEVALLEAEPAPEPAAPDPDRIEEAAKLLGAAKRPMIVAGGGAVEAGEELRAVAELLQAPVVTQRTGRGILSDHHYLSQHWPAGHRLWAETDAVLGVGTRLQQTRMVWGEDENMAIVRIDVDPEQFGKISTPAVAIAADAKLGLAALAEALGRNNLRRPSRKQEMADLKASVGEEVGKLQPQMGFLGAIRSVLPEDGFFVDELTQVGYVTRLGFPVYHARGLITAAYQGTLGCGFATALGVQAGNPERKVVSISGDGGFMFTVQELATAVQYRIPVVAIVFEDGAFGNVQRMQKELYGGRVIATELKNPDFLALAESFGAAAFRAKSPKELGAALEQAFGEPGPSVIHVPVGEMPDPWHLIHMPRVRGGKT